MSCICRESANQSNRLQHAMHYRLLEVPVCRHVEPAPPARVAASQRVLPEPHTLWVVKYPTQASLSRGLWSSSRVQKRPETFSRDQFFSLIIAQESFTFLRKLCILRHPPSLTRNRGFRGSIQSAAAVAAMALRVCPNQAVSFGALVASDGGRAMRKSRGRVCVMGLGNCHQEQQVVMQQQGLWGAPVVRKRSSSFARNASAELASGGGGDEGGNGNVKGYGGGDDSEGEGEGGANNKQLRDEALLALTAAGKTLESLPADLASAVQEGRITGAIVNKFFELQDSKLLGWLLKFAGFKERLLADDLFMTKVAIECGVGIFTKTAAELEKRKENFSKELDFVIADVVMALIADFMLVWLPAPTVSLRPRLTAGAGGLAKFFYNCPDNAFQVALGAQSFSLLQRVGAIIRNGSKLLAVGTTASLVGTASTNALIAVRRKLDKNFEGESEDIPILQTSLAYGVYMAVSSNLRYQILAGVVEQRLLEPMLHNQKLLLSVMSFAVRTGNTFLGSLMWVDYARWVGVQKDRGAAEGAAAAIEGAAAAIEDAASSAASSAGVAPA